MLSKVCEMATPTRQRSKNFSAFEVNLLLDLLTPDRVKVIESKKTDNAAVVLKNSTWGDVMTDFYAQGGESDRDLKTLKNVWKRLKEQTKKQTTEEQREIRKTGGGPKRKVLTPEAERVRGMLPTEQLYPPLQSLFDCDRSEETNDEPPSKVHAGESLLDEPHFDALEVAAASFTSLLPPNDDPNDNVENIPPPTMSSASRRVPPGSSKMSAYHKELLTMARAEHVLVMENLRLKNEMLKKKLEKFQMS